MSKSTKRRAKWVGGHAISIYDLSIVLENGLAPCNAKPKIATYEWLFYSDDDCVFLVCVLIGCSRHFRENDCFEVANFFNSSDKVKAWIPEGRSQVWYKTCVRHVKNGWEGKKPTKSRGNFRNGQ